MKKYLSVYNKVKKDITDGALKYGDKLPSKRALSELLSVSVISVEHAYELLISEGYVESKERSGYFVAYTKGEFYDYGEPENLPSKTQTSHGKDEGISFDKLAKTTRYVLNEYGEELLFRPDNKGTVILRRAIKNYLQRNKGINVDIERIIIGSGAEHLYGQITELLENVRYAIESPTYEQTERVYKSKKADLLPLSIGANGIPSETLKSTKADVLHITPFKNFPTGVCADVNKKAEYLNWAHDNGAFIIEDDYDSEFSVSGSISETVFSMDKDDCVIYVNSFSKTIARSLRVGYMILPKRLVKTFDEKLGFYSCTVPTLEQYVVATILSDGSFEKHINKIRRQRRLSFHKTNI